MQIDTLITRDSSDTGSPRAQPSHKYTCSHASLSSGQGSPRDSPSLPRAPVHFRQACIKKEQTDHDLDGGEHQSAYTFVTSPRDGHASDYKDLPCRNRTAASPAASTAARLKRSSTDSDDEDEHAAGDTLGKKVRRLSGEPAPSTEAVVHEFACPFYKRNRSRYCHQRSCRTSGWPSVHRVKEHLYRHHMHYVCDRCSTTFKIQDHLREHLRQEVACKVAPRSVAEDTGFDAEIEKRLRSRKKIDGQNEVDKWNHMFRILFPSFGTSTKPTPSPFVEYSLQDDLLAQPEPTREDDARDSALQTMAMAAIAKHEPGAGAGSVRIMDDIPRDLPPMRHGACPPGFAVYPHPRDGPHGALPGTSYRSSSNTDPRVLSGNAMYEMVQQQVWKVLSSMPNSPMAPIPHKK